jgi:hypothetical protein
MTKSNRKARRAWAAACHKHIKRGRVSILEIQHDDWCAIYSPARLCNCNPVRILKDDSGNVLARVEGAGFYDPLELMGGAQ